VTLEPGTGAVSQSPHDEFLALCAISTSGELSREEQHQLQEHLAVCSPCRETIKQYEAVVRTILPTLALAPESLESDLSWSPEQAEAAFFERLILDEELGTGIRHGSRGHERGYCLVESGQSTPLSQPGDLA